MWDNLKKRYSHMFVQVTVIQSGLEKVVQQLFIHQTLAKGINYGGESDLD